MKKTVFVLPLALLFVASFLYAAQKGQFQTAQYMPNKVAPVVQPKIERATEQGEQCSIKFIFIKEGEWQRIVDYTSKVHTAGGPALPPSGGGTPTNLNLRDVLDDMNVSGALRGGGIAAEGCTWGVCCDSDGKHCRICCE